MSAVLATDAKGLQRINAEIAKALDSDVPAIDFNSFIVVVQDYECWKPTRELFKMLQTINSGVLAELHKQKTVGLMLFDDEIARLAGLVEHLEKRGVLLFKKRLSSAQGPNGISYLCHLEPIGKMSEILDDPRCRI